MKPEVINIFTQAELDEQAERGWELEEVGLFTATFRRAERPRRCWVEPARWKSERKKDWDARSDYLTLCGEAGWELLEEDGCSEKGHHSPQSNTEFHRTSLIY